MEMNREEFSFLADLVSEDIMLESFGYQSSKTASDLFSYSGGVADVVNGGQNPISASRTKNIRNGWGPKIAFSPFFFLSFFLLSFSPGLTQHHINLLRYFLYQSVPFSAVAP